MFNQFKIILGRVFRKPRAVLVSNIALPEVVREREPKENELILGWTEGMDEETDEKILQLKGIDQSYRDKHFYVVGSSGFGKTKFLENLIIQDIKRGNGFCVIDPHGDLVENIKGWLYFAQRELGRDLNEEVVLIEPTNPKATVSFNPLERIKTGQREVLASEQAGELLKVFEKIWHNSWGARMEDIMRNSLIALAENDLTLTELPLLLTNDVVRQKILKKVKNTTCLQRFDFFNTLPKRTWREWSESTLNKVNAFLSDPRIRDIFSQPKSSFNLREIMDSKKILLVNLDKGQLKGGADLLGSLLLSKIQMAAFSRTDVEKSKRVPFYLYIDEFQNFATGSFIETLSEARKYNLSLVLAHQNLAQLPKELRGSILANCGLQACFQVSREDAQILAKEMLAPLYDSPPGWEFNIQHLQALPTQFCFVRNKAEGGIVLVKTYHTPDPWELAAKAEGEFGGVDEASFRKTVNEQKIGEHYMRARKKVERAYKRRTKKLTTPAEPKTFRKAKK